GAFGYGTTNWGNAAGCGIAFSASQTWTDTAQGGQIAFVCAVNGTTSQATAMTVQNSGGLSIGSTTDPGTGGLLANGAGVYFPGVGTTASAANAFINNASSPVNQLLRSTSSL